MWEKTGHEADHIAGKKVSKTTGLTVETNEIKLMGYLKWLNFKFNFNVYIRKEN